MRIIHFADLHLGIETYGAFDASHGLPSRVVDFLAAFDRIVDHAIDVRADAVLFAGDAFKNRDPSPTLQREFARRIVKLSNAEIPIVLLVGNHDVPATTTRAAHTEIYQVLNTPHVHVMRSMGLINLETRSGPLQVLGIPWITRSMFLADEGFRAAAEDDLDSALIDVISKTVQNLIADIDAAHPAVLLAHLSVQGASFGFERSIMLGRDLTLGIDDLKAPAFDYVALGHIHKHQQLAARPPIVYSGSPERVDFGEEREGKGFVDLTISPDPHGGRTTEWAFVDLPTRPFRTLRIDATGAMPMEHVEREIQSETSKLEGAIVRCFVEVDPGSETSISPIEIRRLIASAGAAHVARVVVESESRNRPRLELRPGDEFDRATMLERWVSQREYSEDVQKRLLTRGRELIDRQRQGTRRDTI